MFRRGRYGKVLVMIDTCQAASLIPPLLPPFSSFLASSRSGEESFSFGFDLNVCNRLNNWIFSLVYQHKIDSQHYYWKVWRAVNNCHPATKMKIHCYRPTLKRSIYDPQQFGGQIFLISLIVHSSAILCNLPDSIVCSTCSTVCWWENKHSKKEQDRTRPDYPIISRLELGWRSSAGKIHCLHLFTELIPEVRKSPPPIAREWCHYPSYSWERGLEPHQARSAAVSQWTLAMS